MNKAEQKGIEAKLKGWFGQRKLTVKLWLYKRVVLAGVGFVGLNAVDGYLTNSAHQLAVQSGIQRSIEANPFLASVAGHWALSFKGVIGLGVFGVLALVKKYTPDKLFWLLILGCVVFLGIVLWNLYWMGWLRW